MDEIQRFIWKSLCEMSGEKVARAFTSFHGNQSMSDEFYIHLVDEGYIDDELGLLEPDEDEA